jgi:hypothetical protein
MTDDGLHDKAMILKSNHASIGASKLLVEAGIVLETDFFYVEKTGELIHCHDIIKGVGEQLIPAPSMAEVWRELRSQSHIDKNPTDALIKLLIWWVEGNYMGNG